MPKARYNKNKYLSLFDSAGDIVAPADLTAVVLDADGATAHTLEAFTRTTEVPSLLISEAFKPIKAERYTIVYKNLGTAILTETLEVGLNPIPEFPLSVAATLYVDADEAGGISETVTLKIFGSDLAEDSDDAAAYDAAYAGYTAAHTFTTEDDYFAVWLKEIGGNPTPFKVVPYFVHKPSDKETVTFTAYAPVVNNENTPHVSTTVVFCDATGAQFAKTITDSYGAGVVELLPGTYVASLLKTDIVFTNNNFATVVIDTDTETGNNIFLFSSESSQPTVTDPSSPQSLCVLTADIFRMDGTPLALADVMVRLVHRPQLFSGTTVFDTGLLFQTDHHGHLEFSLMQGIQVEVAIAPLSLRRVITVPSSAGPTNIMTLLGSADDVFDVITPVFPTAPVRTL